MVGDSLYFIGWRPRGRARQWIVGVHPSVAAAADVARGYARFDGGGPWRVYASQRRPATRGGEVAEVRGAVLATGFERPPHAAAVEVEDGGKVSGC